MEAEVIEGISKQLSIVIPDTITVEQLEQLLSKHINDLINNDLNGLIRTLYAVDVDEANLKGILKQHNGANAATLIARMIIERQVQKFNLRRNTPKKQDDSQEERW